MNTLSKIFYIYSNASVAVMMAIFAILELVCGLALQFAYFNPAYLFFYGASMAFAFMAISLAGGVYRSAKTNGII